MKQRMVLIVSVVVGLMAFWMTQGYFRTRLAELEKERDQLRASERRVEVIAAGRELPAGTVLNKKDLASKFIPARDVTKNTVQLSELDRILNKKLKYPLDKAETVMWSYVDVPFRPGSGLAPVIPPGRRAISIAISGAAGVSGLVQPNDRVDVLGSFSFPSRKDPAKTEWVTLTILQDVSILATGQTLGKSEAGDRSRPGTGYSTVTLDVTLREAELLVFVENMRGHLTLALRNPEDVSYENNLPEINFSKLEEEIPVLNSYRQQVIRHKSGQ